ncbi:hypothetical protein [Komagataeibacter oboediens]
MGAAFFKKAVSFQSFLKKASLKKSFGFSGCFTGKRFRLSCINVLTEWPVVLVALSMEQGGHVHVA